jgi:conjugal transfer pilus assembly protein TraL
MRESIIPQHLDEPERYFIFTPDELGVVIMPLGVGTVFFNFVIGLGAASAAFYALRKFKKGQGLHRLVRIAYWVLPSELLRFKATPPSHLRELAG